MKIFKTTSVFIFFFLLLYLTHQTFHLKLPDEIGLSSLSGLSGKGQIPLKIEAYKMRMLFEPNMGQVEEPVRFISRGKGYTLFLTANEAILSVHSLGDMGKTVPSTSVIRMRLAGATANPQTNGQNLLQSKTNYFLGNQPESELP